MSRCAPPVSGPRSRSRLSQQRRRRNLRSRSPSPAAQLLRSTGTRRAAGSVSELGIARRTGGAPCGTGHREGLGACAPFTARAPPVMHPPMIGFHRSVRPRVFSTKHSEHENTAPITIRLFPHERDWVPISFIPRRNCSRIGRLESSSVDTLELNGASTAPRASPKTPPAPPAIMACIVQLSRNAAPGSDGGSHGTNGRSVERGMAPTCPRHTSLDEQLATSVPHAVRMFGLAGG